MSITDPGAEQAGTFWVRHNISDHDDASTSGAWHLSDLAFNGAADKWAYGGGFATPTATANPGTNTNLGTSPPVPVVTAGSTDDRGVITFGTGTGSFSAITGSAQLLVTVVFGAGTALSSTGHSIYVDVQENNFATRSLLLIPVQTTSGGFITGFGVYATAGTLTASQANTTYSFIYKVES